jgi:hypothetical protein
MSHIFEALRKSDKSFSAEVFATPEKLLEVLETHEELGPMHSEIKPASRLVVWPGLSECLERHGVLRAGGPTLTRL